MSGGRLRISLPFNYLIYGVKCTSVTCSIVLRVAGNFPCLCIDYDNFEVINVWQNRIRNLVNAVTG